MQTPQIQQRCTELLLHSMLVCIKVGVAKADTHAYVKTGRAANAQLASTFSTLQTIPWCRA
jgi:hypothetical protein